MQNVAQSKRRQLFRRRAAADVYLRALMSLICSLYGMIIAAGIAGLVQFHFKCRY